PRQVEGAMQKMVKRDAGRVVNTVVSGIEQALWDIVGQELGVPVHRLFGGALHNRIRLYANINRHVRERTPGGFARAAAQSVDEGFTAIKLAPFDELRGPYHVRTGPKAAWRAGAARVDAVRASNRDTAERAGDSHGRMAMSDELRGPDHVRTGPKAAWRAGVARVEAVRAAIGDEVELVVDCHGRMDMSEALVVADALADCNLFWYEEPVPDSQIDDLAAI